ncbi:hypothetical protein NDI39_10040 [Microcoleus sp. ZQ-A2]|nr:hypothetical protein [Microcoleus sp. FACHB-1]
MELNLKDRIQLGQYLTKVEEAIATLRMNPQPHDERLEELRQQYETVLGLLESAFLAALVTGNWTEFDQFVEDFKCTTKTEGVDAAVELKTPSSIPNPTTTQMIED